MLVGVLGQTSCYPCRAGVIARPWSRPNIRAGAAGGSPAAACSAKVRERIIFRPNGAWFQHPGKARRPQMAVSGPRTVTLAARTAGPCHGGWWWLRHGLGALEVGCEVFQADGA